MDTLTPFPVAESPRGSNRCLLKRAVCVKVKRNATVFCQTLRHVVDYFLSALQQWLLCAARDRLDPVVQCTRLP